MKKLYFLIALLLGVGLVAAACGSSDDDDTTASAPEAAAQLTESYDVPGSLELTLPVPDVPAGTILDTEELDLGADFIGYRILYASRSLQDEPIAVSGYVVSRSETPPAGGWPLVAWAHGTVGTADRCAPSNDVPGQRTLWEMVLNGGYAVVATDYEGLGTPGLHPYIVGESEARGVFDSVRAVQNHDGELPGIEVTSQWITLGHSQGGHAVMHVAERWQDYAPELELIGAVAGAPPSQFDLLYNVLVDGPFKGYIVMALAAFDAVYPEVVLEDLVPQPTLDLFPVLEEECLEHVFETFNPLTREEISLLPDPLAVEPIKSLTEENDVKNKAIQTPLLIIHGEADEQIPVVSSQFLVGQLCVLDNSVSIQRNTYPGEGHSAALFAAADDIFAWAADRFAGEEPPAGCS